jgi:hypothetical protein
MGGGEYNSRQRQGKTSIAIMPIIDRTYFYDLSITANTL